MRHLILVPHQDDEMLNCYSIMKLFPHEVDVAIVFKGGGEPKPNPYTAKELYIIRCQETMDACAKLGIKHVSFLDIPRGTSEQETFCAVKSFLFYKNYGEIFTSYEYDNHPEHQLLGKIIRQLEVDALGFITKTDLLIEQRRCVSPEIFIRLTDIEYEEKIKLIDVYETQKHFLPNIVRRPPYRFETFWRINNERTE